MSLATRSQKGASAGASSSHTVPLTPAEAELLQKQLEEKENLLREQSNALRREREEWEKRQVSAPDFNSVIQTLKQLQTDVTPIRNLQERFDNLEQKIYDQSRPPSVFLEAAETSTAPLPSVLKIKDVLPNIPLYDGYKMSIFQFARACERARDLLPSNQEPQLTQLIINKLEGDAQQLIEGGYYDNVTALLDKLKSIFAPNKSVSQYRGELANAYKLPSETVLKYAGRIKTLKMAIIDCYRRQRGGIDRHFCDEIDGEVLEAFINGLPTELITRIEHRPISNLDQAIEWAAKLSRTMEIEKARERQHAPRISNDARIPRADVYKPVVNTELNMPNKIIMESRKPFIRPLIPGVPGPNSPNVCRYCKFPGHDISVCRKLAARNAPQLSGNDQGGQSAKGNTQTEARPELRPSTQQQAE